MREERKLTLKIFVLCFVFNGILLATLHAVGDRHLQAMRDQVEIAQAVLEPEDVPVEARTALTALESYLEEREGTLLPALLLLGVFMTLLLACATQFVSRRVLKRTIAGGRPTGEPRAASKKDKKARKEVEAAPAKEPARPSAYPAVQVLSALQQEGRFVDFLQEDLGRYEDTQIGAAVRSVHEGCRKALAEHLELAPVFEQEEGTQVTVKKGFDARAVRLTGNVAGDPPFRGVLRHRGWRVSRLDLPIPLDELLKEKKWVLAPAEVEIDG